MKNLPQVIIIGRANVGKSTLFNRLIEKPKALTSKLAGTTRDTNIGQVYWQGVNFELIDTGGVETIIPSKKIKKLSPALNIEYTLDIIEKTQSALKKADLILFLVDIQTGLLPQDKELGKILKRLGKQIIFVANKTDSLKLREKMGEFFKLGFGEPFFVSALNGSGTGDLLDEIVKRLKKFKKGKKAEKFEIKQAIKIAIIGKPNVGKSSLLNSLLQEERAIVSPLPHTTREAIDTFLEYKNKNLILIDTAGIRKQAKISKGLEKISVKKSLENARNADVCLLVLDISEPIGVQDNKLSKILIDANVSIIIVANKWDKIEDKTDKTQNDFQKNIYRHFSYLTWVPIIFVSALTHKNVYNILDLALQIYENRNIKISDSALNKFLKQAIKRQRPLRAKGSKHPYLLDLKQIKTDPPRFQLQIRKTDTLSSTYIKYLENALRQKFNLLGTPVKIMIKQ